jgi:hypothetical protein
MRQQNRQLQPLDTPGNPIIGDGLVRWDGTTRQSRELQGIPTECQHVSGP